MIDYISGLWIDQNHPAFKMKILLALLTSLTFVVCSRIECNWSIQFLCGDKCLGNSKTCYCGNENFVFNQTFEYYCCPESNTSCAKSRNGDVRCHQGQKLQWNEPCHGSCRQLARFGNTLLPCDDKNQCYQGIDACMGTPQCTE